MKKYLVLILLLIFTFNSNSIAQELKNCVFGKNTLDFVIDKTKNIVSQLNKEKGTEQIYNIKEIKNNMIISEVSLFDGKDNEGIELNLDFNLFKAQPIHVKKNGSAWEVLKTYEAQCEKQNNSQQNSKSSVSSSSSNELSLFGLNASMDMTSAESALNNKGYECLPLSHFDKLCVTQEGKQIKISDGLFVIMCSAYGGCAYKADEVKSFFEKELNIKISSREVSQGLIPTNAICGEGPAGDKICIVNESISSDVGPSVHLMKHKLGSSGMTLN